MTFPHIFQSTSQSLTLPFLFHFRQRTETAHGGPFYGGSRTTTRWEWPLVLQRRCEEDWEEALCSVDGGPVTPPRFPLMERRLQRRGEGEQAEKLPAGHSGSNWRPELPHQL